MKASVSRICSIVQISLATNNCLVCCSCCLLNNFSPRYEAAYWCAGILKEIYNLLLDIKAIGISFIWLRYIKEFSLTFCSTRAVWESLYSSTSKFYTLFTGLSSALPGGLQQLMHSECIKEFSLTFRDCLLNKGGVELESLSILIISILYIHRSLISSPRRSTTADALWMY